ncbi:C_GCAxxG_C_C family protein [Dehalogenimonas lykanthroporepellens BL-DC-9]|jgi:C_GCAxxG_C_C family probable redox protein|nr:C_GCAxxG_C_C family protein [Dehalogenimonas lykanthroporepellens BL-DC-9]
MTGQLRGISPARVRRLAEAYYSTWDYYCSEAIVKTIGDEFQSGWPPEIVAAASGFPVGFGGAGCTCGALSGGVLAIGMFFGRTEPRDPRSETALELSRKLHEFFIAQRRSTCCRKLTRDMVMGSPEHMSQCIAITGEIAEQTARLIAVELGLTLLEDDLVTEQVGITA